MNQIPFFLVTGFLGSGKTTFLNSILSSYDSSSKIAIIQNEFAPANIDGEILKKKERKFELLEINNGSVFCVCLLNDFISSLHQFLQIHQPDMVLLEASGLSDPIAIAQLLDFKELKKELYLAKVWTIVDAVNFLKQHALVTRLQHQVRIADLVILNKVDLSSEVEILKSEDAIRALNPFAKIIRSTYCQIPEKMLTFEDQIEPVAIKTKTQHSQFESCGRPEIGVGVMRSSRSIEKEKLIQFIDKYAKNTIRIKGFAKLPDGKGLAVHTSYLQMDFKEIDDYQGSTELIAIGEGFDLSEFSRKYRALVK